MHIKLNNIFQKIKTTPELQKIPDLTSSLAEGYPNDQQDHDKPVRQKKKKKYIIRTNLKSIMKGLVKMMQLTGRLRKNFSSALSASLTERFCKISCL